MAAKGKSVFQIEVTNKEELDAAAEPLRNTKAWSEPEESWRKWCEFVLETTRCKCALPEKVELQEYGLGG